MKIKLSKLICFLTSLLCITSLSACGNNLSKHQNDTQTEQSQTESSEDVTSTDPSEPNSNQENDLIEKITVAVDETGIYATVITLSDKAADKGVIEMIYGGVKGSPQENSVVNTFRIEYYKEDAGTFEITTFYDGEVYQNLHHQNKVKVNNTFGATVRAGNITVFYTPDGGGKTEIYKADAESFIKN